LSLKGRLNRFKSHLTIDKPEHPQIKTKKSSDDMLLKKWEAMQAKPFYFDGEYALVREVVYPLDHQHGKCRFSDLKSIVDEWTAAGIDHPLSANGLQPDELLFFDTETTGLSGGVGNTIFLLGYCRVLTDRVVVKQYFLPSPSSEAALFQSFLTDVKELRNLVTYNGKSFDWPQVKTRHTLLRDTVPRLPQFGHFDLLHASRRLWKGTLESNRLAVVERDILGFARKNDTPGHLVPLIYFEYLKEEDPKLVEGILKHNEHDLLSLISLYIHISGLLLGRNEETATLKELYEVGRWYDYIGSTKEAVACFRKVADTTSREALSAKKALADMYKRQKRYDQALDLWRDIYHNETFAGSGVLIEIAKVYEHHYKDVGQALYYAKQAYRKQKQRKYLLKYEKERDLQALLKRINRLERKFILR
jgi:uncharacterized protein YprB with RNaseH-like and TPR domain